MLVTDIDAELVGKFLDHIETERGNTARSRNTRLTAVRSFFSFVAINEPGLLHHCQQVLALPAKRYERPALSYLEHDEIEARLAARPPGPAEGFGPRRRGHCPSPVGRVRRVGRWGQREPADVRGRLAPEGRRAWQAPSRKGPGRPTARHGPFHAGLPGCLRPADPTHAGAARDGETRHDRGRWMLSGRGGGAWGARASHGRRGVCGGVRRSIRRRR